MLATKGFEMIRSLKVAKSTAIKARTQCVNALKAPITTAPDEIREQLRNLDNRAERARRHRRGFSSPWCC